MLEINAKTQLLTALGDSQGSIYQSQDIEDALKRSLIQYSTYFPCLRNMGQATLVKAVASGSNTIEIIGGFPSVGLQYTIGYGSVTNEIVTIASFTYTPYNTAILTLTSNLVNQYYPGQLVSIPVANGQTTPVLGLQLQIGQDTYQLPLDFIEVEPASFSIAIGERPNYRDTDQYYDQSQVLFGRLNSTGYGFSQGWASYSGAGYPIYGNPFAQPSKSGLGTTELVFNFIEGDFPYMTLNVPASYNALLSFQYYGMLTWSNIPNNKAEIISLYAQYAALMARATAFLEGGAVKIEDYEESNDKIARQLMAQADDVFKKWQRLVNRPVIISG